MAGLTPSSQAALRQVLVPVAVHEAPSGAAQVCVQCLAEETVDEPKQACLQGDSLARSHALAPVSSRAHLPAEQSCPSAQSAFAVHVRVQNRGEPVAQIPEMQSPSEAQP